MRHGSRTRTERRSRAEWAVRIAIALAAAALGALSVGSSLANAIAKVDPGRAHPLSPNDAGITAALAEQLFALDPQAEANSRPARLAEQALLGDPTAVRALSVLGFQAQLRGDAARADRLFAYSTRLSRRELRAQLWAIEKAAQAGDVEGALRHYNNALKTSDEAQAVLFPILAAALKEPRIRASVLRILSTRPPWAKPFISYVTVSGVDPDAAVDLFREGSDIPLPVSGELRASLVGTLLSQNQFDEAWSYYTTFRPTARRTQSRDPSFSLVSDAATPFDWVGSPGTELEFAL